MTTTAPDQLLAAGHAVDFRRHAAAARLAALAACCRPSSWALAGARARRWLDALVIRSRADRVRGAACCAGA